MPNHYTLQGWGDGTGQTLYPGLLNMDKQIQHASYRVNVKEFGAVGDGVTDDSAAFAACASYIAGLNEAVPTNAPWPEAGAGERVGRAEMYIPAGAYLITQDDNAFIAPPTGSNVQGLTIRGAGRYVTQIIYKPAAVVTERYLIRNAGTTGGWLNIHFEDLHFQGGTSGCSFMLSTGPIIQNYTFQRVYWTNFRYGIRNQGTDNNDHFRFWHCGGFGTFTHFLWLEGSDQFLSYQFYAFDFEVIQGNFIRATLGGDINMYGGSLIMINPPSVDTGTFFKLEGTTHSEGTTRFKCSGARVELRTANAKVITSEWPNGVVEFDQLDTSPFSTAAHGTTSTIATFNNINGQTPLIKWKDCRLMGRHEYGYQTMAWAYENHIVYEGCEVRNFDDAKDFVYFTNISGTANLGSVPKVSFKGCRGKNLDTTRFWVFDTDINWQAAAFGRTEKKWVGLKMPWGQGPVSTTSDTASITLPLNSVITRVSIYWPPFGTSTATNWSYTLRTTEGTPTTIHSVAGGGTVQLQAGFSSQVDKFFVCDTDAKRKLDLVSANATQGTVAFLCMVEYVG